LLAENGGLLFAIASVGEDGEVGYAEGEGCTSGLHDREGITIVSYSVPHSCHLWGIF
jgi:hypothetical protein